MNQATGHALVRHIPALRWLPTYDRHSLGGDLLAAAIVTALLVPQALGYAGIAGVPLQVGLYAVPLSLVAYALLGSSPQLVVGPASTVALVSGSLVARLSNGDGELAVAYTSALAIAAGAVLVVVGLLRVGWLAEFLSKPIVTGFVFGLTLTIVVGELPVLLGLPREGGRLLSQLWSVIEHLPDADPLTAAVAAISLVLLFAGGRFAPRVPWGLVTLALGIVVSDLLDLSERGVAIVGEVPTGLPPFGLPSIPLDRVPDVVIAGVSLALVGLAEGLSAARLFAARGGYRVDADQELLATGAANVAAGLSGGFAVAGSLSKTATAVRAGARTQVTGLGAAAAVVVVLLVLAEVFTNLPRAVLAAIVVNAVWALMDVPALRRYARVRRADLLAATAALLGVVLFGPLEGLLIAIAISLFSLIFRASRPGVEAMGKIPGEKAAWGRLAKHPERHHVRGVVVVRLGAPLFWVNAELVQELVLAEVDARPDAGAIVVDLEATTELDTTSIDSLVELLARLRARDVELYLVRVFHTARRTLERTGFEELLGPDHVWHSISAGVRAAKHHLRAAGRGAVVDEEEVEHIVEPGAERIAAGDDTEVLGARTVPADVGEGTHHPEPRPIDPSVDLNVEHLAVGADWIDLARRAEGAAANGDPARDGEPEPDGEPAPDGEGGARSVPRGGSPDDAP